MSSVSKQPFFRRVERWSVGLVMATLAYLLEKAVLRSIRRGRGKPEPLEPGPRAKSAATDVSL